MVSLGKLSNFLIFPQATVRVSRGRAPWRQEAIGCGVPERIYGIWASYSHGIDGPNRNRWFPELQNGGSFHGKLLVISRW